MRPGLVRPGVSPPGPLDRQAFLWPHAAHSMVATEVECRLSPRFETSVPVQFCSELLEFEADLELQTGELTDVSAGGVFVRSDYLEPSGTAVRLRVRLPGDAEPLILSGCVVWVAEDPPRGPGMGVRLDEGSPVGPVLEQVVGR